LESTSLTARVRAEIKEVILENFMSYEYARIPLKRGLNIICGPNGAGKSSILLGISVALGQTYTERSRKLSDLVRHGKKVARVSLIFDNKPVNGRRPIRMSKSDTFMISRYLRSDGSYWYEADYKEISRAELRTMLDEFGLNPDNMMLIMHQGMIEEFSIIDPVEKLKMMEEAVGFQKYRLDVIEAQQKLSGIISEETALKALVENASQTLDHWKGVYERYLRKRNLMNRRDELSKELFWARYARIEKELMANADRKSNRQRVLEQTYEKLEKTKMAIQEAHSLILNEQVQLRRLYFSMANMEGEKGRHRATQQLAQRLESMLAHYLARKDEQMKNLIGASAPRALLDQVKLEYDQLTFDMERSRADLEESQRKYSEVEKEAKALQSEIGATEQTLIRRIETYVQYSVDKALLELRRKEIEDEISQLDKVKSQLEEERRQILLETPAGERIETARTITEISDDLRLTQAQLGAYEDIPAEAEEIYNTYQATLQDLEAKLHQILESKERILKELEERRKIWRSTIQKLLEKINPTYSDVLSSVGAVGAIRLIDDEDIEKAGLEMLVGFKGDAPRILDAYTQSGGEKSVAIMAFLLSMQQQILSPLRAVDEFDVHMDPRNREAIFKMIIKCVGQGDTGSYIVVTPSQLTVVDKKVHLLMVQSTGGGAKVAELSAG